MKKIFIPVLAGMALISITTMQSCKKDDTASPLITLSGANPYTISLNSTYTDPGATASDDEDGSVTVSVDASGVNKDLAGSYIVHYTATDKAGNQAMEERTVIVKNDADYLAGSYVNAYDTCGITLASHFDATVTASTTVNRKFSISNFGANGSSVVINLSVDASDVITATVPQSLGGPATLTSILSGTVITHSGPTQFTITYGWNDGTQNDVCISTYTR